MRRTREPFSEVAPEQRLFDAAVYLSWLALLVAGMQAILVGMS